MKELLFSLKKAYCILDNKQKVFGGLLIIAGILAALFETIGVSIMLPLVTILLDPSNIKPDSFVFIIVSKISMYKEIKPTTLVIVGVVTLYVVKNLYFVFYSWIRVKYACKIERELSMTMLKSYMERGYQFFLDRNVNELVQGSVGDVGNMYYVVSSVSNIITQGLTILCISIYMVYTDWEMALGIIISALLCLGVILLVFKKKMYIAGLGLRKYAVLSQKTVLEMFYGIKEIIVMRKQNYYVSMFEKNTIGKQKNQIKQTIGGEIPAYIIEAVCICGIMLILAIRVSLLDDTASFVPMLAAFAVGAFRILPALGKLSSSINIITSHIANMDAIYENVITARKLNRKHNYIDAKDEVGEGLLQFKERICVNRASFSYSTACKKDILKELDCHVNKGEFVAIVGESGAGKSTLGDVLLGVLEVDSGNVTIDGINIQSIPNAWSRLIGFVPQSIYLSDATIKENVAMGVPEEEISIDEVRDALRQADLLAFVDSLEAGLDTVIGDRGIRLSGGQRQRIGIARALYRKPQILLLDEATSALDSNTEDNVMDAIIKLHGQVTLIVIAHRLSTISDCDRVYEIVDGKAIEQNIDDILNR